VFILKEVKVFCFDTLLQVLILKGLSLAPKLCILDGTGPQKGKKAVLRWSEALSNEQGKTPFKKKAPR
jgi:hypothetical protein